MQKLVSVFYTATSRKDLQSLANTQAKKIVVTIKKYTVSNPLSKAKELSGIFEGMYRYRIGDYRAIFDYDQKGNLVIVTILKIKHRQDIYK